MKYHRYAHLLSIEIYILENKLFYFRSSLGQEADLILEDRKNQQVLFTEIKYNQTARPIMVEKIKNLIKVTIYIEVGILFFYL